MYNIWQEIIFQHVRVNLFAYMFDIWQCTLCTIQPETQNRIHRQI